MPKLELQIKNRDLDRVKTLLEYRYQNDEQPIDLSTNDLIMVAITKELKRMLKDLIHSAEHEKKKKEALQIITVDDIDFD